MSLHGLALRRTRTIALVAAWLATAIGILALMGWVFDSPLLKTALASDVSIKANAAVALTTMGVSLLGLTANGRTLARARWLRITSCFVSALGMATLSEHLFGYNLGIDELIFSEPPGAAATASPGRMGIPACLSFTLLGIGGAFLGEGSPRAGIRAQWFALAVMPIPLLAVTGYATDARQLYGIAGYTGIALHTAVGILLLALGLFLSRAEQGPASLLVADNPGGEVARTMLPVAVLLPMALGWLRMEGQRRGLYHADFGRALLLLLLIVVLTVMVWRVARRLSAVAEERRAAEQASSRAQAEARRLEAENLYTLSVFEALLAHAPIGLVFLDRSRHCVKVNEFLTRTLGPSAPPHLGRSLFEMLPGSRAELDAAIDLAFGEGKSTVDLEMSITTAELERIWMAGVFPVLSASGGPSLCGVVLMEITERKRLEAQRVMLLDSERAARVEAERAATLKDQFLATLSHELRTPLNAILGWTRLARQSPDTPHNLERPLEIIERNARAQAKLIEDLLDISRIVSGKMHLTKEPVDLAGVVQAAVSAAAPAANTKRIRVEQEVAANLPILIGDPARLQQAVGNLLSNALKFTPQDGRVLVRVVRREQNVELSVSDTGIGIPPEFLPHVFDRFRQADASTTRRHGGLGLGLAIVKQLVELHGGTVSVASPGQLHGATFAISLPLVHDEEPAASLEKPRDPRADVSLEGLRVLVVDDEVDARELLGRVLSEARAEVKLAASADEALTILERDEQDVVVSDIGMPGKDGFDLMRALHQRYGTDAPPAIAVTAFARVEDRVRVMDAGFRLHVPKPIDPSAMVQAIAELVVRDASRSNVERSSTV